jgi:hypothetical protein
MAGRGHFAVHNPGHRRFRRGEMMTSAMVTLGIAVGGTSLICYALMTRLQNRRANRRSSGDSSGAGNGNHGGGDGWSISNWFGGDNSVDSSGNPGDSGGGDSGGGGDGGGGGGGGGD